MGHAPAASFLQNRVVCEEVSSCLPIGGPADGRDSVPRRSYWWPTLVAVVLSVLALSGCRTGASGKHESTNKVVPPSSTAHPAAVEPASKIAFISNRTGTYNVYVVNDDGGGLRDLTPGPSGDTSPSWSPDGTRVIFASDRGGAYDIFVMKANGKGILQLSDRGRGDAEPAFSSDGKRVAFVECDQSFAHCQLWAMNANGKDARRLTRTPVEAERPSWSPDGTKIVVTIKQAGNLDVAVVVVRGGAVQRLTHGDADDYQPSYSPDGARIAFGSNRAGAPSLYVMQADGAHVSSLTSPSKGQDEDLSWQPATVGR